MRDILVVESMSTIFTIRRKRERVSEMEIEEREKGN